MNTHVLIKNIESPSMFHPSSINESGDTQHLILYGTYKQQAQKSTHTHTQGAYTFK